MNPFRLSLLLLWITALSGWAQTTTWRAADNPHVVSGTYVVPVGQTLIMEAGVVVQINASSTLQVDGQLLGNGTAAQRIQITGATNYNAEIDVRGKMDLKFTDVKTKTVPDDNGILLFADCNFTGNGTIFNGQVLQRDGTRAPYLQLDRCLFTGDGTYSSASLYVAYCTVVVRNTSFNNASYMSVNPGYLFIDHVSSTNSTQFGLTLGSDSDLFIDNVSVTNATAAGLVLDGDTRNGTNVLLGPNVLLQNNEYPIQLTIAGLYPASTIPATGNRKNLIEASKFAGTGGMWPKFAIPYYVDGSPLTISALFHIQPGVTVKMAPFCYMNDIGFADGMRAYGTKAQPITFERADPTKAWYDLHSDRTYGGRMRHVIVDGSSDGVNGGDWRLENCIFRNNAIATNGGAIVSGSQYLNNGTGHYTDGNLNNVSNPNSFEGNTVGVNYSPDARNVWWGSPTGPRISSNPGGTGDPIQSSFTQYKPFLTTRPNYNDTPPEVALLRPSYQLDPGSKVTLRWDSSDDAGIVSHKILFSPVGNNVGSFQVIATLPGSQRSYEWTVPNIGFQVSGNDAYVKVVAVDTTGKEGFDEWEIVIPTNDIQGTVTFPMAAGQTFGSGEIPASFYTPNIEPYMTRIETYVDILGAEIGKKAGRGMPHLSTDAARFVISYGDTTNHRKYWYSPVFKIRPDNRLGDAPPIVSLTSPAAGAGFAPGAVIPITWTASDDEGLRSFDIIASYDGGKLWQPIVKNLPGTARNYDWQTAPGTGYADVRVLVLAKDWRFQISSDGASRSFATNSNSPTVTVATIALNPPNIATGGSSTGTVTLTAPAPAAGALVTISNSAPTFLTTPANITIPSGATSGTFPITTTNIAMAGQALISATSGGVTKTAIIDVTLALTNLALPSSAQGGATINGSVVLSGPAPDGGAIVHLSSANPNIASVPASVTVSAGATSASFTATTQSVATQSSAVISGEHSGTTQSVTVSVTPAPFDAWRNFYFPKDLDNPAISGADADPDHDGIPNLLENKLGLSPKSPDALPRPVMENGKLTMTFKVSKAATDIALKVQVANTPTGLPASDASDSFWQVITEDAQTQTVKATDVSAPVGARQRCMRLSATR